MAKQTINIGTTANDGTGDPLRTALEKVNANFTELYGVTANYMMMINGSGNVVASGIYQSAAGNLLIGTTTDDGIYKLQVNGSARIAGTPSYTLMLQSSDTYSQIVSSQAAVGYNQLQLDARSCKWLILNIEKMLLSESGNLLVGTTADDWVNKTQINGGLRFSSNVTQSVPNNYDVQFVYSTNTALRVSMRGSDGVVRSAIITLA